MVVGEEMNGEDVRDLEEEDAKGEKVRLRCSGAVGGSCGDGLNSWAGCGDGGGGGLKPFTALGSSRESVGKYVGRKSLVSKGTLCFCPAATQDKASKRIRHFIGSLKNHTANW